MVMQCGAGRLEVEFFFCNGYGNAQERKRMDEEIYHLLKMGDWVLVDQHKAVEALAANQRRDAGKPVRRLLTRLGLDLLVVQHLSFVNDVLSVSVRDCPTPGNPFAHTRLLWPCLIFSQKWQGISQSLVGHGLWYSRNGRQSEDGVGHGLWYSQNGRQSVVGVGHGLWYSQNGRQWEDRVGHGLWYSQNGRPSEDGENVHRARILRMGRQNVDCVMER